MAFKVERHKANVHFYENGGSLEAHINVELTGRIEELTGGSGLLSRSNFREHAQRQLETAVKDEILQTANKMQHELTVDGYNWLETMRRKQYSMYQRHSAHWRDIFTDIKIVPNVSVNVNS